MASILKPSEIDVSKITFSSNVKTLESGGKMVWAQYQGHPLMMQLPTMKAPFGVSEWADDKSKKYFLDLSFDGKDSNEALSKTYDMLKALDNKMLSEGMDNSMTWFKKRYSTVEVVEALYCPIVRMPKDEKYSPTLKFPLAQTPQGDFKFAAFDGEKKKINVLDMNTKGARVTAIVQLTGVWLAGGKFGASWKVQQLRIVPRATLQEYAFIDDESSNTIGIGCADDELEMDNDDEPNFREDSE